MTMPSIVSMRAQLVRAQRAERDRDRLADGHRYGSATAAAAAAAATRVHRRAAGRRRRAATRQSAPVICASALARLIALRLQHGRAEQRDSVAFGEPGHDFTVVEVADAEPTNFGVHVCRSSRTPSGSASAGSHRAPPPAPARTASRRHDAARSPRVRADVLRAVRRLHARAITAACRHYRSA